MDEGASGDRAWGGEQKEEERNTGGRSEGWITARLDGEREAEVFLNGPHY